MATYEHPCHEPLLDTASSPAFSMDSGYSADLSSSSSSESSSSSPAFSMDSGYSADLSSSSSSESSSSSSSSYGSFSSTDNERELATLRHTIRKMEAQVVKLTHEQSRKMQHQHPMERQLERLDNDAGASSTVSKDPPPPHSPATTIETESASSPIQTGWAVQLMSEKKQLQCSHDEHKALETLVAARQLLIRYYCKAIHTSQPSVPTDDISMAERPAQRF